jgi:hypothetical protein
MSRSKHVKVSGVSPNLAKNLQTISESTGVAVSSIVALKIHSKLAEIPASKKTNYE